MQFLVTVAAGIMGNFCPTLATVTGSVFFESLCNLGSVSSELTSRLSSDAHIYYPGSENFTKATTRWSSLDAPNVTVIVEVATENDVAETVKYANARNIPFVALNGGHGAITTLGRVQNGIEIWLRQLDSISIADNGRTATFGGGALSKEVTDTLWAKGKQTVTGGCECTSLLGPGLGGGHGFLQGRYGLISDQFVSMNIVLANGSLVSIDKDSDLWWAVNGAGHNFGIVTSVTSNIYDVPNEGLWSYHRFIFTYDKVEGLYEAINEYLLKDGTQPVDLINYSFFFNSPDIDPDHAVIALFILREGIDSVESKYTQPFMKLDPATNAAGKGTYKDLPEWTNNANDSPPCQKAGLVNIRFPVDLPKYNPVAQHAAFDTFSSVTRKNPALNNSLFLFEGYSLQGVQDILAESTAFPHREGRLLVSPLVIYEPADENHNLEARAFGESLRQIVFQESGQEKMYSYVNYAFGNEGPESWYGYEPWRLGRLRNLKAKYDPVGRFNFYAPFT